MCRRTTISPRPSPIKKEAERQGHHGLAARQPAKWSHVPAQIPRSKPVHHLLMSPDLPWSEQHLWGDIHREANKRKNHIWVTVVVSESILMVQIIVGLQVAQRPRAVSEHAAWAVTAPGHQASLAGPSDSQMPRISPKQCQARALRTDRSQALALAAQAAVSASPQPQKHLPSLYNGPGTYVR